MEDFAAITRIFVQRTIERWRSAIPHRCLGSILRRWLIGILAERLSPDRELRHSPWQARWSAHRRRPLGRAVPTRAEFLFDHPDLPMRDDIAGLSHLGELLALINPILEFLEFVCPDRAHERGTAGRDFKQVGATASPGGGATATTPLGTCSLRKLHASTICTCCARGRTWQKLFCALSIQRSSKRKS
jgi:hypothetical protein